MRYFIIYCIVALTIFPPLALTDTILTWWLDYGDFGLNYWGVDKWWLIGELTFIWVCYLGAILILMKWSRDGKRGIIGKMLKGQ